MRIEKDIDRGRVNDYPEIRSGSEDSEGFGN
jgi:hypothetical protein